MATFIKDPAGWKEFTASPASPIYRDMAKRGVELRRYAMRQVGKKSTRLVRSITTNTSVDFRGIVTKVGSDNKIALMHHTGTRPHVIVPKRAKTLRFVQRGKLRYAQRVFHPGTKPNRYLTDNLIRVVN